MTTSQFKHVLFWRRSDDMYDPGSVLLLVKTFQNHVVACLLLVVYKLVLIVTGLNH